MSDRTHIEWTDATWNPITGCTMVSAGCTNCYAMGLAATRLRDHPSRAGLTRMTGGRPVWTGEVRLNEQWLDQPLRWRKPRRIFVCAHGDLFHESVPDEWIDRVFAVMALAPRHTFQVLTKRPARALKYLGGMIGDEDRCRSIIEASRKSGGLIADMPYLRDRLVNLPLPNVWIGTSIEDQATANARIPHLLATRAAVRFISAEPLLGPVQLGDLVIDDGKPGEWHVNALDAEGIDPDDDPDFGGTIIDWVIVGGESGTGARPMHPEWVRSLRDQCNAAGVPFFFKQWGDWAPLESTAERICAGITGDTPRALWHDAVGLITDTSDTEDGLSFFSDGLVFRIGKRAAGRLLDGREWNEAPT